MKSFLRALIVLGAALFLLHIPIAIARFANGDENTTLGPVAGGLFFAGFLLMLIPLIFLGLSYWSPSKMWRSIVTWIKNGE